RGPRRCRSRGTRPGSPRDQPEALEDELHVRLGHVERDLAHGAPLLLLGERVHPELLAEGQALVVPGREGVGGVAGGGLDSHQIRSSPSTVVRTNTRWGPYPGTRRRPRSGAHPGSRFSAALISSRSVRLWSPKRLPSASTQSWAEQVWVCWTVPSAARPELRL